jgi:hypothetical protein
VAITRRARNAHVCGDGRGEKQHGNSDIKRLS